VISTLREMKGLLVVTYVNAEYQIQLLVMPSRIILTIVKVSLLVNDNIVRARVLGSERGQQLTLGRGPSGSVRIMTHLNHREDNDVARLFHISN